MDPSQAADRREAGRLAMTYLAVAGLWIVLSDRVATGSTVQSVKGLAFVAVTAGGLHWLTYRLLRRGRMNESDRRMFAQLADHDREAIVLADPDDGFRITYLNATARSLLAGADPDATGHPVWRSLPELDESQLQTFWTDARSEEPPEFRINRRCPGEEPEVWAGKFGRLPRDGRQLLSVRLRNVTDQAAEEARQHQLLCQLTESEQRLALQKAQLEASRQELELFNRISLIFLTPSSTEDVISRLEAAIGSALGVASVKLTIADAGLAEPPGSGRMADHLPGVAIVSGTDVLGEIRLGNDRSPLPADTGERLERIAQFIAPTLRSHLTEVRCRAEQDKTLALALANETKFAAIFNNSLGALLLVDAQSGRITECNRQAGRLFAGGNPQRLIGLEGRLLAANPRSREEGVRLRAEIAGGIRYETDQEFRSLDGSPFWGQVSGEQLHLPGADLQLFRIVDITQRRAADQRLAAQAQFQRALIDSVPLPVFVKDTRSRYLECNRALAEFIGVPREALIGKTVTDVFSEEDGAEYLRRDEELFLHQGRQVYQGTVRSATGEVRSVIFHKATFHRDDGALGGLIGTFIDVTDTEGAMDRMRLQESALNAAANGILITDRRGIVLWANPACERLTGYTLTELVGASVRILKSGLQDSEFYRNLWTTVLAGHVWQGEINNRRKDGTNYLEEMTITPLKNDRGEVTHFVAIKQDISSRKQMEMQYLRAQRMEGVGLLASGIAHDLNNVLAPVLLSIELLQAMHPDADTQEILHTVEQSARRGADIVRQVLTFARGVKGERIPLQPKHLVKDIVRVAKETFPKNIEVHIRMDTEVANVEGDPTQIHQVLLNLAVNARDAMPDGGRLTLIAKNHQLLAELPAVNGPIPPGDYVILAVRDTGIGIDPGNITNIFEPFFSTKTDNKGTGLGLPTALGIVKSHAGYFRVISQPAKGSEFEVYLPVCHRDESSPAPGMTKAPRGNGETVLVVDDEPGIRSITSEILSRHGYRVLIASDGTDAMALVAQHRGKVELVLTDVMMPHMDGVALVRSLRKLAPHTRVLAFSGLSKDATLAPKIEELRRLGLPPVLSKPLAAPELLMALHELLNSPPQG